MDKIASLKHSLRQRFAIKDLGVLKYFLGVKVATSKKGLFLNVGMCMICCKRLK